MEEEIWKPVPEYEEKYHLSDIGRVKSLNYKRSGREGILKPVKQKNGYLAVVFPRKVKKYIHYLVAQVFIPNPENKPCIDHIDGNKLNNCVSNLRWCSYKENCNNPITRKRNSEAHIGLQTGKPSPMLGKHHTEETKKKMSESLKGENNPMYSKHHSEETKTKISEMKKGKRILKKLKPVVCLKDDKVIKIYDGLGDVEKDGFYYSAVCQCCKGKRKSHAGYQWMYLSDYEKRQG